MKSDARWMRILAFRVLINTIIGSMLTTATGAVLLGNAGASVYAFRTQPIWTVSSRECGSYFCYLETGNYGAITGAICGLILGLFIFPTVTINEAQMRNGISAFINLCARVVLGQCFGVCCFVLSYFVIIYGTAQTQNQSFDDLTLGHHQWIIYGAPALMICGAIAGALTKRDLPKVATLKAE